MKTRSIFMAFSALALAALACGLFFPTPTTEAPSSPVETKPPSTEPASFDDMESKLADMGGQPCDENPDFTCVTIQVPLDHFDAGNTETLGVVFAVAPAAGERYGMYVQAFPGGPGGEGVSTGSLNWFSQDILEHYDIVFFDQRGVGLSNPLACPTAYAKDFLGYLNETDQGGLEGYDTPQEQQAAIADARNFVEECVNEIGIEPDKLRFFGTDQVAEDLESFRQAIGDEKFMLYGVSYGTGVAQTYATAYPEHLSGLVLDGTQDLTLTGEQGALSQEKAFDKVLVAALEACNKDPVCAEDVGGNALDAYDHLAKRASNTPISYEFPLPSGEKIQRTFTFNQLEFTTAYQMYSLSGRTLFLRALAAANQGDMVPMARLLYQQGMLDPETFEYLGDPTFSDTMFYNVLCTDDSFYSGTPDERIEQIIKTGQASNGTVPRLDGSVYTGLTCAYWPGSPAEVVKNEPLIAQGVPTFVLNATLDPATPFEEGKAVFERLADGYHLYVEGGRHSINGWGYECPDDYISDFLLDGELPAQREIVCEDWGKAVIQPYYPLIEEYTYEYPNLLGLMSAIDHEINYMPEYFYGYFEQDVSVACPLGGSFTFGPSALGEALTFKDCEFIKGFALTGNGSYDYREGLFTIEAQVSGEKTGSLAFIRDDEQEMIFLTGEYDGKTIDLKQ